MAQRLRIGNNMGTTGYFLSQPADNVTAPAKNLLIDSRYPNMNIHATGRQRLDVYNASGTAKLYYTTVTFASLGYRPLYWASIIWNSVSGLGIPDKTAHYPGTSGRAGTSSPYNYNFTGSTPRLLEHGIWLENNTTLRCKLWVDGSANHNIQLTYVIMKNRETT